MSTNQRKDQDKNEKPKRSGGEKQSGNKGGSQQSGNPGSGSRQDENQDQQRNINRKPGQDHPTRKVDDMPE